MMMIITVNVNTEQNGSLTLGLCHLKTTKNHEMQEKIRSLL